MPPTNNHPCTLAAESALAVKHSLFPRAVLALVSSRRDAKAAWATTLQLQLALVLQAHQSDYCQSAFKSAVRLMFSEKKIIKVMPASVFQFIMVNCSVKNMYILSYERWLKSHCDHLRVNCHGILMDYLHITQLNSPLGARQEPPGEGQRYRIFYIALLVCVTLVVVYWALTMGHALLKVFHNLEPLISYNIYNKWIILLVTSHK